MRMLRVCCAGVLQCELRRADQRLPLPSGPVGSDAWHVARQRPGRRSRGVRCSALCLLGIRGLWLGVSLAHRVLRWAGCVCLCCDGCSRRSLGDSLHGCGCLRAGTPPLVIASACVAAAAVVAAGVMAAAGDRAAGVVVAVAEGAPGGRCRLEAAAGAAESRRTTSACGRSWCAR